MNSLNKTLLIRAVGLVLVTAGVLLAYQFYILPQAALIKDARAAGDAAAKEFSILVTIGDVEQMMCLIGFLWVTIFVIFEQFRDSRREQRLLRADLLPTSDKVIRRDEALLAARPIEALPAPDQDRLLPRALGRALSRFHAGHSVEDVSRAVAAVCGEELARLESLGTTTRYVAWAIPSIGFVGTVRGIGLALGESADALQNNELFKVTNPLGLAFDSTFVSLLLSLVLMLFVHWLQSTQEDTVQSVERYLDHRCVNRLEA